MKMLRTACLALPVLLLPGLAPAQETAGETTPDAAGNGADTVVATVAGQDITAADLRVLLTTLPEQYRQLPPEVLLPGLIDQVVQQQALALTVEEVPAEIERELAAQRRSRVAAYALTEHLEGAGDRRGRARRLRRAGRRLRGRAQQYDASHILLESGGGRARRDRGDRGRRRLRRGRGPSARPAPLRPPRRRARMVRRGPDGAGVRGRRAGARGGARSRLRSRRSSAGT